MKRLGGLVFLVACARPPRIAPSPARVTPPADVPSAVASDAAPPSPSRSTPWAVVLDGCAETTIASASGATIVLTGLGAARVDGFDLRPLPIPLPRRDLETVHVDDVVGVWPDRAWILYSPSVGEDTGRFAHVARVHPDRVDAAAALRIVAAPRTSLLVLESGGTTLTASALTDTGLRPVPFRFGPSIAAMQNSGVGLERLHDAVVLRSGIVIADADELAVHRITPGRPPAVDRFSARGQVRIVDALPLVTNGSVVHAAFNVQLSTPVGQRSVDLQTYLARFDGQAWTEIVPPPSDGEIDSFDVGADLWVAAGGKLFRRPAGHAWEEQPIPGRVVRVAAAHGSPVWAITQSGGLWKLENGSWSVTPLPSTVDGKPLFARRVHVRASDEVWLGATTDPDDPDWPRTARTDALLRLGGTRSKMECSSFSTGRFFTQRAKAPSSPTRCNKVTFIPPLAGWMRPEDEPVLRHAVTRIASSATFDRLAKNVFDVTVPSEADARRLLREPTSALGGWRAVSPEGCKP